MAAAVLLHPHPDFGGNQHNNVISALYERLPSVGVTPHRFDFTSSDFEAAREQTVQAVEAAGEPVVLVGYSFGGAIAASVEHPMVKAWCLLAPALTLLPPAIGFDERPKYVVAAGQDTWFGPDVLRSATADWVATEHDIIAAADHFFRGGTAVSLADLAVPWIKQNA